MRIRVQLFAVARQLAGRDAVIVDVAEGATVADVRSALLTFVPQLESVVANARWAVDAQFVGDDHPVGERAEMALIPPVSGG